MSICRDCKYSVLSEYQNAMLCRWSEAGIRVVLPNSPKCDHFESMSSEIIPPPKDAKVPGGKYQSLDSFMRETFSDVFLAKAASQYTLAQISGRVFDATAKHIDFDPDAFAKGYVDLLHEVEQLRKHRVELLGKYEALRAKMQRVIVNAIAITSLPKSGAQCQIDKEVSDLVECILEVKSEH